MSQAKIPQYQTEEESKEQENQSTISEKEGDFSQDWNSMQHYQESLGSQNDDDMGEQEFQYIAVQCSEIQPPQNNITRQTSFVSQASDFIKLSDNKNQTLQNNNNFSENPSNLQYPFQQTIKNDQDQSLMKQNSFVSSQQSSLFQQNKVNPNPLMQFNDFSSNPFSNYKDSFQSSNNPSSNFGIYPQTSIFNNNYGNSGNKQSYMNDQYQSHSGQQIPWYGQNSYGNSYSNFNEGKTMGNGGNYVDDYQDENDIYIQSLCMKEGYGGTRKKDNYYEENDEEDDNKYVDQQFIKISLYKSYTQTQEMLYHPRQLNQKKEHINVIFRDKQTGQKYDFNIQEVTIFQDKTFDVNEVLELNNIRQFISSSHIYYIQQEGDIPEIYIGKYPVSDHKVRFQRVSSEGEITLIYQLENRQYEMEQQKYDEIDDGNRLNGNSTFGFSNYLRKDQNLVIRNDLTDDKRKNERSVKDALQFVQQWRETYKEIRKREKPGFLLITYAQVANEYEGCKKKTLDYYFLELRQAEALGYNFKENLEQKMGDVRKFNQDRKPQHKKISKELAFQLPPEESLPISEEICSKLLREQQRNKKSNNQQKHHNFENQQSSSSDKHNDKKEKMSIHSFGITKMTKNNSPKSKPQTEQKKGFFLQPDDSPTLKHNHIQFPPPASQAPKKQFFLQSSPFTGNSEKQLSEMISYSNNGLGSSSISQDQNQLSNFLTFDQTLENIQNSLFPKSSEDTLSSTQL